MNQRKKQMYQDANGKVGDDPALLTPPLVSVSSCQYDRSTVAIDMASTVLRPSGLSLGSRFGGSSRLVYEFDVRPPAKIWAVQFQGMRGCSIELRGGVPEVISGEKKLEGVGLFNLRDVLKVKVERITLVINGYQPSKDDTKTYVRFLFRPDAPVIASVGLALRAHEASMDCQLLTDDGEKVGFHRAVLAARSAYFDKLFFGEFKESKTDVVKVEGGTTTWQCINAMLYTQTLPKSDRITLIRTLEIVYHYDLEAFAASVWHALVRKLDGVVAVRALRVAGLHQNKEISAEAMEFIKEHILTLMLDREWVRRYADVLEEITDPGRPSLGT